MDDGASQNSVTENIEQPAVSNAKIARATFWSFVAEFSAKIIVPITNMILARLLLPEVFGIIATINMVITFAETFSTAGFQKYIVQHNFEDETSLNKSCSVAFWTNFTFSVIAWVLISVFSTPITRMVGNPGYEIPLIIASFSIPLMSFASIHEALFQRNLDYKVLFYLRLAVAFSPFVVTIPLALAGLGFWSLIIGSLSGLFIKAILLVIFSKWKPEFYFKFSLLKEMFSFCFWTLAESLALWATTNIDILIISNRLGDYYTGLYKNSQATVTGILSIITGATTSVLFAALSRAQRDERQFSEIFYNFQKKVAIFVLPLGIGIFCFSDLITMVLLGNKWVEASDFIGIWGLCTSLVCVFGTFSREVYRAKGKPVISLIVQLLHLAFVIPVCLYGVNKGFETLAYVRSFAYAEIIIIHMFFIKFMFRISPFKMLWSVKEPAICSVLMGGLAVLILRFLPNNYILQFAYVIICGLFYFALLAIFKPYREEMKNLILTVRNKFVKRKKEDDE